MVSNRHRLASYLYKVLNSSCAKLLASKFSFSSQKKVEKKFGSLESQMTIKPIASNNRRATGSGSRSLGVNLAEAINALDKVSNKRLNTGLYLMEIKRFSSSSSLYGRPSLGGLRKSFVSTSTAFNMKAYIAGFIDGEGNFFIKVVKSSTIKTGYSIQLSFGLILHARELELLKLIQSELSGVGYISESVYGRVHYQISNIKDLEILFALLDEFPLLTRKMRNYQLFKEA